MTVVRRLLLFALWLPAVAGAQVLSVTLLGTGMPQPEVSRFGSAVLVEAGENKLLFDAGRGVAQRLNQLYVPLNQVNRVFITHMHYDHIVGLPDLMLSGRVFQRDEVMDFWGPPDLSAHLENLMAAYKADLDVRAAYVDSKRGGIEYKVHNTAPGVVYQKDDLRVTAFMVDHRPVHPAFGYRIDYAGRSVVISGDTRYSKEVEKQASGADLLIHEVATASDSLRKNNPRLRKILDYHTSPSDLNKLLKESHPKLTVLTHIIAFGVPESELLADVTKGYDGEVRLGEDLMAFDIGNVIIEYRRPR